MFRIHETVVYPGHGVAKINRIIEKNVGGKATTFYELKFINKDMIILVPTTTTSLPIRELSSPDGIEDLFKFLSQPARKVHNNDLTPNWKQRNKEYQTKLRTGNLKQISEIYRELKHIERYKELSFCEKNLLIQTESLLAQEIALVNDSAEETAVQDLRAIFNTYKTPQQTA